MVVIAQQQEVTVKQAARLDEHLLSKGKVVEHISFYVHYHPWRFSVSGEHCQEYEVKIEAAVSRYVDNRDGHSTNEPYNMLVMLVSCDQALVQDSLDKRELRRVILYSLSQAYNLKESRITFPIASQVDETIAASPRAALPLHLLRSYPKSEPCPRELCGGMMIADTDGRLRCVLCARYKNSV